MKILFNSNSKSIFNLLRRLWGKINLKRKFQIKLLVLLMILSGISEFFSIAMIFPFIGVIIDSQKVLEIEIIKSLIPQFIQNSPNLLLIFITILFCLTSIIVVIIKLLNLWANSHLASAIGVDLSCSGYENKINEPYSEHLKSNTSEFITATTRYIPDLQIALCAGLNIISTSIVALCIIFALLIINFDVAISCIGLFGLSYFVFAKRVKRTLKKNGKLVAIESKNQVKALQEGLGSIREVILNNSQPFYLSIYRTADFALRKAQAEIQFISKSPRYIFEGLGLILIALIATILNFNNSESENLIPTLATFALGAQRLLPSFQQIYSSWAAIRSTAEAVDHILTMTKISYYKNSKKTFTNKYKLNNSIEFKNVFFNYLDDRNNLKDINFKIKKGSFIGIIGPTGSGKSTILDLILGLLKPTSGTIFIDNLNMHNQQNDQFLNSWWNNISHVPQSIYLSDNSITENIACGIPKQKIDFKRVKEVAQIAQISSFIESTAYGYNTHVGERGIRLSGGQKQRIGIARALYKDAKVILFDEATSALDTYTESKLMKAIENLNKDITLIMIAHRISTLKNCDSILEVEDGRIINIINNN